MRSWSTASPRVGSPFPDRPGPALDGATLARLRQARFHQQRALRIGSDRAAVAFVDAVGFCSTFHRFGEGVACLWEAVAGRKDPRWPRHSHHDAAVGFTWDLKDRLATRRQVYYGKLLKGRPVLVALDLLPAFYALIRGRQRSAAYLDEYRDGRLSALAKRIMDSLVRESPQYTRGLRAESFTLEPSRTHDFERAMAELQQGLWVVKTEERYEPTFSYRWDLVERWLPDQVAEGRRLRRESAVEEICGRYLDAAVYSTPPLLARLLAVPRAEVEAALGRLERAGRARCRAKVASWPGHWVVSTGSGSGRRR
jgi:hypothetical protein